MNLINCPECGHPMGVNATICPNCNSPRKVGRSTSKKDVKRKTPSYNRKTRKPYTINFLLILVALVVVVVLSFFFITLTSKKQVIEPSYAKVNIQNGLYVYVESTPLKPYKVIDKIEGEKFIDIIKNIGIGKEKLIDVAFNIIEAGKANFSNSEIIETITKDVHNKHDSASGVIFSQNMRSCQVIKFE